MLDTMTPRGALIAAALRLAAERPWKEVTLAEIAGAAGTNLAALKKEFADKGELLAAFSQAVDDEVLGRAQRRGPDQPARDALFEVLMSRFDVLAPYKTALRSIARETSCAPAQFRSLLASQQWMLEAAGIGTGGMDGGLKTLGLASLYASVFRVWLDEDDAGHPKTMAALDRRLRRGEHTLQRVHEVCSGLSRFARAAMPRGFAGSPQSKNEGPAAPSAGPQTGPAV